MKIFTVLQLRMLRNAIKRTIKGKSVILLKDKRKKRLTLTVDIKMLQFQLSLIFPESSSSWHIQRPEYIPLKAKTLYARWLNIKRNWSVNYSSPGWSPCKAYFCC